MWQMALRNKNMQERQACDSSHCGRKLAGLIKTTFTQPFRMHRDISHRGELVLQSPGWQCQRQLLAQHLATGQLLL